MEVARCFSGLRKKHAGILKVLVLGKNQGKLPQTISQDVPTHLSESTKMAGCPPRHLVQKMVLARKTRKWAEMLPAKPPQHPTLWWRPSTSPHSQLGSRRKCRHTAS